MKDNREKLLQLIKKAGIKKEVCTSDGEPVSEYFARVVDVELVEPLVDYLIAGGVTINQWISVEERLPEIDEHHCSADVIVFTDDGVIGIDHLEESVFGSMVFSAERPSPCGDSEVEITHWMPLPEPPAPAKEGEQR